MRGVSLSFHREIARMSSGTATTEHAIYLSLLSMATATSACRQILILPADDERCFRRETAGTCH
jgi:hypothetical protein